MLTGRRKRKGSFAIYLEPWHSDILIFLNEKNHGKEELRAREFILCALGFLISLCNVWKKMVNGFCSVQMKLRVG